ncbi:MAG: ABC transporter permease [Verrucomicrobiae bacterium]|nr:ABC transporter permease [Verrucomicrobiae bacterium]
MRAILLIGHHEVRLFLRDRGMYLWLFVVPLVFVYFMSFAAPAPGGPDDARPGVRIDNRDAGFLGRVFLRELGQQGLTLLGDQDGREARRGITVPADFTDRILAGEKVELELHVLEGSDTGMAEIVKLRLLRALLAMNARLARHAIEHAGAPPTEETLLALMEVPEPVGLVSSHAGRKPRPVGFGFSLPGNLVAYLFLNLLIFGGARVAENRRSGLLARLATQPITTREILFGNLYALMLLAGVQVGVLLLVGQWVLGVDVAANLVGVLLTLGVLAWVAGSLGMLIGFLVASEDKVIGICLAIALPAAALGGCWWPIEIAPAFARHLANAVPTGWALSALHTLITFGAGLDRALPSIGVLALFGIAANVAAARFLRLR